MSLIGTGVERWLSAADQGSSHEAARKLRHEDTGLWLINSADYIAWRNTASPLVWLYGIRKCFLAGIIMARLLTLSSWLWKDSLVVGHIYLLIEKGEI